MHKSQNIISKIIENCKNKKFGDLLKMWSFYKKKAKVNSKLFTIDNFFVRFGMNLECGIQFTGHTHAHSLVKAGGSNLRIIL